MSRPMLLDAFCGAGGAAVGYHRAGFNVVGVDIAPQPRYPFTFHQGDALEFIARHGREFDAIHASPPCQLWTGLNRQHKKAHTDLLTPARERLQAAGAPYVIENVAGAPLIAPVMLCGTMFGLKVYRHRLFECSWFFLAPPHGPHRDRMPRKGGGISPKGYASVTGHHGIKAYASRAMGIDWMTSNELSQAIPPAYCEFIGTQLLRALSCERRSA